MSYDWGRGGSGALSGAASGAQFGPWGAAAGGVMGALGGFGGNPTDDAMKYYQQIPGQMKPYYDPYINAGRGAMGQLQGQYGRLLGGGSALQDRFSQMMSDPNSIMQQIGQGYQKSPGFNWQLGQGEQAINNASQAGGMVGTPQHQQQAGQLANNLANQDFQQYMTNTLGVMNNGLQGSQGLYGMGMSGLQDINHLGYGASSDLATNLAQALMSQGNLQYAGQNNQNQQNSGMLGNAIGGLGNLFGKGGIFG